VSYTAFLDKKTQLGGNHGFDPIFMPDFLFDFQKALVEWALRKGRAAIFADCGLGKTPIQLVWADNVARKTGRPVLILAPLAVGAQTVAEGDKFGIECARSRGGEIRGRIVVANYERLHLFRPDDFEGVVCDESSILKSFDGVRRGEITAFMRKIKHRLLCTATAAPNDFIELGSSSEALGHLGHMDMLNRFFKNDQNNSATHGSHFMQGGGAVKWRFKGHAEIPFWKWVCSWARAVRKPSDIGFDDAAFILPELIEREHIVKAETLADGMLFALPACGLKEQREERRRTINERCEKAAEIVNGKSDPSLVWCQMNDEGDLLERLISGAVQVSGKDSDDEKEEKLIAFATGKARVLITKPKIGAWGLNFQHCNHMTFFPSHSFEQYYQGVRRCLRFGQKRAVCVDIVATEGDAGIAANLKRKAAQADSMFQNLVNEMNNAIGVERAVDFKNQEEIPSWLLSSN
jgi:hypothetical protein